MMLLLLFVALVSSKKRDRATLMCKDYVDIPEVVVEWWTCRPYISKRHNSSDPPDGKPTIKIKFLNIVKFKVPDTRLFI